MRKSTLLLLLVVAACGEEDAEGYELVQDFLARTTAVECTAVAGPDGVAVTRLRAASDSTLLVLDGPGRTVQELDRRLAVIWEMRAPGEGPGSLDAPADAVLLGDSAVAIAERTGLQLIIYSRAGELIRSTPIPFFPHSLGARSTGEVLVTAMPMGATPANLLFRFDGTEFHEVAIPARPYPDMTVGALGNSAVVGVLAGDHALVVHQFLAPRAFRVGADGDIEPLRVPTPDATRAQLTYVPKAPIMEDQLPLMLVPAVAMSVDRGRGEVYILTKSGRRLDGRAERAILRTDERLRLLDSYTIDVMGRAMAFLPSEGAALIVDDEDRFHVCQIPLTDARHARVD